MRLQLNGTIKGMEGGKRATWVKGQTFDDSKGKSIPKDILATFKVPGQTKITLLPDAATAEADLKEIEKVQAKYDASLEVNEDLEKRVKALTEERDTLSKDVQTLTEQLKKVFEKPEVDDKASGMKFLCPVPGCGKDFNSDNGLAIHLAKMHPGYEPEPKGDTAK